MEARGRERKEEEGQQKGGRESVSKKGRKERKAVEWRGKGEVREKGKEG